MSGTAPDSAPSESQGDESDWDRTQDADSEPGYDCATICSALPTAMREARRWLLWKSVPQGEGKKPRKIPFYVSGVPRAAGGALDSATDIEQLATLDEAMAALQGGQYTGLGFALGPDGTGSYWQGIDFDGLSQRPPLWSLIDDLPGYTELSPSGDGWHAIGYGQYFETISANAALGIEAYAERRFFTVTGDQAGLQEPCDLTPFIAQRIRPLLTSAPGASGRAQTEFTEEVVDEQTLNDLDSALEVINADDYHMWVSVGHALKPLGTKGRERWLRWSAKSTKFDPVRDPPRWDTFQPTRTGYKAVFALAQKLGWANPGRHRHSAGGEQTGQFHAGHHADGAKGSTGNAAAGAGSAVEGPNLTEDRLALDFIRLHIGRLMYVPGMGKWYVWNGHKWAVDEKLRVVNLVRRMLRAIASRLTEDKAKIKLGRATTIFAVETLARSDERTVVAQGELDPDHWALNTPAGILDLRTGRLAPSDPLRRMTKSTACPVAETASCPRWLRFLDDITGCDNEFINYLQRVAGYALTGSTREHVLFFFHGHGGNGKGVFLNTLNGVMGDYATVAAMQTFVESQSEQHPTDLAMLRGARLVSAQETKQNQAWAEGKIKMMTGGDPVTARYMRQDFFTYQPQFKLLLSGNHKPRLRSVDESIRRRFQLVPFDVTFQGRRKDPELYEKLKSEWPGILRWMVNGTLAWLEQGLQPPKIVRERTEEYLGANDFFADWVQERCVTGPEQQDKFDNLYANWKGYCEIWNERPGRKQDFTDQLERHGYRRRRGNPEGGGAHFVGLRVR